MSNVIRWIFGLPAALVPYIVYKIADDIASRVANNFVGTIQVNSTGESSGGHISTGQPSTVQTVLAKDLEITHAEDNRCWKCVTNPRESRFKKALEALHVKMLCIKAKIKLDQLLLLTEYSPYLIFKTTSNSGGLDMSQEAKVYVNGILELQEVCLDPTEITFGLMDDSNNIVLPVERPDGWMEVKLGSFFHAINLDEVVVYLEETNVENVKTGLIVAGIEVRPR